MKRAFLFVMAFVVFASLVSAQDATSDVSSALSDLKSLFCSLVPIAITLMIAAGAVLFAVGSLLGAEQRAKTRVWAMNMFIYAGVAVLLYVMVPWIIGQISDLDISCGASTTSSNNGMMSTT